MTCLASAWMTCGCMDSGSIDSVVQVSNKNSASLQTSKDSHSAKTALADESDSNKVQSDQAPPVADKNSQIGDESYPTTLTSIDQRAANEQDATAKKNQPDSKQDQSKSQKESKSKPSLSGSKQDASKQERKKTAAEIRREKLLKGMVDETEERPDKPTFTNRPKKKVNGVTEVTFDDIKFEMEKTETFKREMLTEFINDLNGSRINIRGYIRPSTRQKGLTKFVFVRDNKECCFGPGAALFDCVLVKLTKGEKSDYTVRPVTVEGDFYVKEYRGPDGRIWAVFRIKNGVVK